MKRPSFEPVGIWPRPEPATGFFCFPWALVMLLVAFSAAGGLRAQDADRGAERVDRMLRDASRALQANSAASFLSRFDRKRFSDYRRLESHLVALTEQSQIASSIDITAIRREADDYQVEVDWLLQLSLAGGGPIESRRELLKMRVAEAKPGRWKIVALAPVEFFRPQHEPGR